MGTGASQASGLPSRCEMRRPANCSVAVNSDRSTMTLQTSRTGLILPIVLAGLPRALSPWRATLRSRRSGSAGSKSSPILTIPARVELPFAMGSRRSVCMRVGSGTARFRPGPKRWRSRGRPGESHGAPFRGIVYRYQPSLSACYARSFTPRPAGSEPRGSRLDPVGSTAAASRRAPRRSGGSARARCPIRSASS